MLEEFLKGQYPMLQSMNQILANSFQITIVGKLSNEQKYSLEFENLVNEMKKMVFLSIFEDIYQIFRMR